MSERSDPEPTHGESSADPSTPAPAAGGAATLSVVRQALTGAAAWLKRATVIGVLLLIALLAGIWYLARPTGVLVLAIPDRHPEADRRAIYQHFSVATARLRDIAAARTVLSFSPGTAKKTAPSAPAASNAGRYDFLKFAVENPESNPNITTGVAELVKTLQFASAAKIGADVNVDAKVVKVTGRINLEDAFVKLYDVVGFRDYYLIVSSFATTGPASDVTLVAQLYPVDPIGVEITAPAAHVADRLAMYVYSKRPRRDDRSAEGLIPIDELPQHPASLRQTVEGVRHLRQALRFGDRDDLLDLGHLEHAQRELERARDSDASNAVARFYLGLTMWIRAFQANARGGAYQAGLLLLDSGRQFAQARERSAYVRAQLESQAWRDLFLDDKYAHFRMEPAFLDSIGAYRQALEAYAVRDHELVLRHLDALRSPPPAAALVLALLRQQAKLELATETTVTLLLDDLAELGQQYPGDVHWLQLHAHHACLARRDVSVALQRLETAALDAPDLVALVRARLWKARCLLQARQPAEARKLVRTLLPLLERDTDELAVSTLYHDAAYVFAALGDWDQAESCLYKLASGRRAYLQHIRHAPGLRSFRENARPLFERLVERVLQPAPLTSVKVVGGERREPEAGGRK